MSDLKVLERVSRRGGDIPRALLADAVIPAVPPVRLAHRLPAKYQNVGQAWERLALALHLMATTGWSLHKELRETLVPMIGVSPRSGTLLRLFGQTLPDSGLVVSEVLGLPLRGRVHLALTRLSDFGLAFSWDCGWRPIESEWGKLIRSHNGLDQPQHTAAVLSFAYHARLRGWRVEVLPMMGKPRTEPDVLVEKGDERIYVEVELGHGKRRKWHAQRELQGFVAFCTTTPARRRYLAKEAKTTSRDLITDLHTLYQEAKEELRSALWARG